jgi:hypothetical protein
MLRIDRLPEGIDTLWNLAVAPSQFRGSKCSDGMRLCAVLASGRVGSPLASFNEFLGSYPSGRPE